MASEELGTEGSKGTSEGLNYINIPIIEDKNKHTANVNIQRISITLFNTRSNEVFIALGTWGARLSFNSPKISVDHAR